MVQRKKKRLYGRCKTQKNLYLEWNYIFLTPECVPSSPPTLSWALSSSSKTALLLCKWVTPMQPPTHQVQYKNLGHPVMTSGFLFPVKNTAPSLTQKHTHDLHARHTLNRAGPGQLLTTNSKDISLLVCLYLEQM